MQKPPESFLVGAAPPAGSIVPSSHEPSIAQQLVVVLQTGARIQIKDVGFTFEINSVGRGHQCCGSRGRFCEAYQARRGGGREAEIIIVGTTPEEA